MSGSWCRQKRKERRTPFRAPGARAISSRNRCRSHSRFRNRNWCNLRARSWHLLRTEARFISRADWDACGRGVSLDALRGRTCYGALDLSGSGKNDLTSLVLIEAGLADADGTITSDTSAMRTRGIELRVHLEHGRDRETRSVGLEPLIVSR